MSEQIKEQLEKDKLFYLNWINGQFESVVFSQLGFELDRVHHALTRMNLNYGELYEYWKEADEAFERNLRIILGKPIPVKLVTIIEN